MTQASRDSATRRPPAASVDVTDAVLRPALERARNADSGWGYAPGKSSRIEPTCWALLALARAARQDVDAERLARWPRQDGFLIDIPGAPINYAFSALAGLTFLASGAHAAEARALAASLVTVRGLRLDSSSIIRQDSTLQAWPWIDGTFSWVEPTAWALLLLKKSSAGRPDAATADRLRVGDAVMRDRACAQGGWNYGSSNVYGQELFPYVPTTALGLLALQDHRSDATVSRALDRLRKDIASERSAMALAMAAIALRAYGEPAEPATTPLGALVAAPRPTDDVMGLAMSVYALSRSPNGEQYFAL